MFSRIRKWSVVVLSVCLAVSGLAQLGPDVARKHAARAGARLSLLQSLRAEGKTFIGREVVPFVFTSARPNKLRVESYAPLRRVIQVYDGEHPPWISHTEIKEGTPQAMTPVDAKEFAENADFDGPLVNFAAKGYSVDYAGEEKIEGRNAYKLLVMGKNESMFFLWVDAANYEIVKRSLYRVANGKRVAIDTVFKDFKPVAGVLQPHRVENFTNGQLVYVTVIEKMEANPADISAETFALPARSR